MGDIEAPKQAAHTWNLLYWLVRVKRKENKSMVAWRIGHFRYLTNQSAENELVSAGWSVEEEF